MDLIKNILLFLEENCNGEDYIALNKEKFAEYPEYVLREHCALIAARGLVKETSARGGHRFSGLTWDGHDFLDNARNSDVWDATKKAAGKMSFGVFKTVLEATATAFALQSIGIKP